MTSHLHFEQAPPRSWDHFEELCADTFQEEWQDSTLVRNGRAGQAQHGVDIVGTDGAVWPVGIQCKRKSSWPVKVVTKGDLDAEVEKALGFAPSLKVFYLVSTAPDDEALAEHARLITQRHKNQGRFAVVVIGWGELVRRATRHRIVAEKHFGAFSAGPASPLLTTWRASRGKLLLDDRELALSIRELIHDLREFPEGRVVFTQQESEDLLFKIKALGAGGERSLDVREAIVGLRDKLKMLRDREADAVAGLRLLFGHKYLSDYVRVVWEKEAPLLVRSYVEQAIDRDHGTVTGLEKFRIYPPGGGEEDLPVAVFVPASAIHEIETHRRNLKDRFPNLDTNNVSELPKQVQFQYAVPALIRKVLQKMQENGVRLDELERRRWLDTAVWRITV